MTLINLSSNDWALRINISKNAQLSNNRYYAIKDINLGDFTSKFIAVGIFINYGKSTWSYGGFLRQLYTLPFATQIAEKNGTLSQHKLTINTVSIVNTPIIATAKYKLIYTAPNWFRDVRVKVWEYRGQESNFVDETLLDIQSKLNQLL